MRQSLALLLASVALVGAADRVHAGGFEMPANDAEALGRGGAFTAKADNGAALEYNVAGLAAQRGTRSLVGMNLVFQEYSFTRAGSYPGPANAMTPYAGQPYPTVSNTGGPQAVPFIGVSTDFGWFRRWTFAVGLFAPHSYGGRTFPDQIAGMPGPQRYDLLSEKLIIAYPTLAAAVKVTRWLEIGVGVHLVVSHLEFRTVSYVDLGRFVCLNGEYAPCDSPGRVSLDGVTATASLGVMLHPIEGLDVGLNLRGPAALDDSGTVSATAPQVQPMQIQPDQAHFLAHLPFVLRLGVRYGFRKDGFERADLELDGTYESWHSAEGDGDKVRIPNLAIFTDVNPTILHHYIDTFGVRVGGAYNVQLPAGVLTLRLGLFYDSPATHTADTRLDFDTLAKVAPTFGLGYRVRGVAVNLAYAYVWSPDRDVRDGDIRGINAVTMGTTASSTPNMDPLPVVNNGHYHAASQILSVSLNVAWDEALHKRHD
jgi:long-subunit fatty acid transport protein